MKLQINTTDKTIKIEESVNVYEFFQMIQNLFPNNLWKDFKLETNVINNWSNPIIIKEYPIYPVNPFPYNPPYNPTWVTCQTGVHAENGFASSKTTYNLNPGIFNIDCQVTN